MFLATQGIMSSKNTGVLVQPAMPSYIGKGTANSGIGDVTPNFHASTAAGDFCILHTETDNEAVATPTGWTLFSMMPYNNPSNATRMTLFYRRYVGGDVAPTITDPGDHCIVNIYTFRGVSASGEGISTHELSGFSATTAFTIPCGTTTLNNQLIAILISDGADATPNRFAGLGTNATLTNFTHEESAGTISNNGGGLNLYTGEKATAGACGSITGTLAVGTAFACVALALTG